MANVTLQNDHNGQCGKWDAGEYDLDSCHPAVVKLHSLRPELFQASKPAKKATPKAVKSAAKTRETR